ncbi:ATP-binding cassette domain-containing protein [Entomospira entomophila]|uniref:ATP-binding cassette domain-containing protein n=1 Tax=Entomospira entomophila TaxID=2719988 RepID=A0A968GAZ5_9SPIO|nr:ATP-binding cassette domain-containing protein [Entomospira entomophilus]NIZ40313.1 ATP-binding cassette domain-containing protein [Entomospira entomophilus]WDI35872.1 ATP-binding cassette domain-containing protein [Entomospira entomophilus]
MMNENYISLEKVQFAYKENSLLFIDEVRLASSGIYAVVGNNGAGKSLFMHLASGRLVPTTGEIYLMNNHQKVSLSDSVESRDTIRLLTDDFLGEMREKVLTYLYEIASAYTLQRGDVLHQEVVRVLKLVDLLELQQERVERLSFGQRRRLSMATVFLGSPQFLFLDEPFTGLDSKQIKQRMGYLKKISQDMCIVMSMHDMELLRTLSLQKILFIDGGVVAVLDPTVENLARIEAGLNHEI